MPKYKVTGRMVNEVYTIVEADSSEEAVDLAYELDGAELIETNSSWEFCDYDQVEKL